MTSRWEGFARLLLRIQDRQWFDAAVAEQSHVAHQDHNHWRLGVALFVVRSLTTRVGAIAGASASLVVIAIGVGWIDLHLEPTSASLLMILTISTLCGFAMPRLWWLTGLIIGASISLTSALVLVFGVHYASGRPVDTSTGPMLVLLVLVVPASAAGRFGAWIRIRRQMSLPDHSPRP